MAAGKSRLGIDVAIAIGVIVVVGCVVWFGYYLGRMSVADDLEKAVGEATAQMGEPTASGTAEQADGLEVVMADTDALKVVYKGIEESAGVEGATLHLEWENKTGSNVTVYPENGMVNGYSALIMSGIPTEMQAGGKSANPLLLSYAQFDATNASEVHSVSFEAVLRDDSFTEVARVPVSLEI